MNDLIASMKQVLANHYAYYLKSHGFHWNVEGPNFPQLHMLFETIYTEVYGVIDKTAEEIRTLDSYAPASFTRLSELSTISDTINILKPNAMLETLLVDTQIMIKSLSTAYSLSESYKLSGLSNFLAERLDAFNKHAWQIRSTLKAV